MGLVRAKIAEFLGAPSEEDRLRATTAAAVPIQSGGLPGYEGAFAFGRLLRQRQALEAIAVLVTEELRDEVRLEHERSFDRQPGRLHRAVTGEPVGMEPNLDELIVVEDPLIRKVAETLGVGDDVAEGLDRATPSDRAAHPDATLDAHERALLACADRLDELRESS